MFALTVERASTSTHLSLSTGEFTQARSLICVLTAEKCSARVPTSSLIANSTMLTVFLVAPFGSFRSNRVSHVYPVDCCLSENVSVFYAPDSSCVPLPCPCSTTPSVELQRQGLVLPHSWQLVPPSDTRYTLSSRHYSLPRFREDPRCKLVLDHPPE